MFTVAITGGISSGKTLVANLFAQKGIEVFDADLIAYFQRVLQHDSSYTDLVEISSNHTNLFLLAH